VKNGLGGKIYLVPRIQNETGAKLYKAKHKIVKPEMGRKYVFNVK
jgi:hypothetical protein